MYKLIMLLAFYFFFNVRLCIYLASKLPWYLHTLRVIILTEKRDKEKSEQCEKSN